MDLNTGINMMDSPVCSFVQSELDLYPENQCFSRLPNELIEMILTKLELYNEIHKLVRLRLVSTLWQTLIDDFCMRRKCLIVHEILSTSSVGRRFFDLVNLNHFTFLCLNRRVSGDLLGPFLKAFPNIERLSICYPYIGIEHSQARDIASHINSVKSLKQLDLYGPFVPLLPYLSATLSKLQHFSFYLVGGTYKSCDLLQLLSHLGPNCTRFYLGGNISLDYRQIDQWHRINSDWLVSVTHLQLDICSRAGRVVHFLCQHATLLKVLNIRGCITMTPALITDLAKLSHLTKLELGDNEIQFTALERAAVQLKLTSHSSLLSCTLRIARFDHAVNADRFTQVLSYIFPTVDDLTIYFSNNINSYPSLRVFRHELQPQLNRFANLCNSQIRFY